MIASMVNSVSELQNVDHAKSAISAPRLQPKSWRAYAVAIWPRALAQKTAPTRCSWAWAL
jgi:hypothetical protein